MVPNRIMRPGWSTSSAGTVADSMPENAHTRSAEPVASAPTPCGANGWRFAGSKWKSTMPRSESGTMLNSSSAICTRAPTRMPSTFSVQSVQRMPSARKNWYQRLSFRMGKSRVKYAIPPVTIAAFPTAALSQYIHTVWNPAKSPNASRAKTYGPPVRGKRVPSRP